MRGCDKLKHLFSSVLARSFVQLQHLEICNCRVLDDIVTQEDEAELTTTFVFPQVTFLKLWDLPELKTFYPGRHTSEWPLLKRLELSGCDKVNIFTSESFSFQEINEVLLNIPVQEALFLVEKVQYPFLFLLQFDCDQIYTERCCTFQLNDLSFHCHT